MRFFTGVGSRQTPNEILDLMTCLAQRLGQQGWVLRSGGAQGADRAFERGAGACEVYRASHATPQAIAVAKRFHPAWHRCGDFARKLHGRNAFQVLGRDLESPSRFLVCWTRDGATSHAERSIRTGGTGTAISIASEFGVPVFNLQREDHRRRIENWVSRCS